MNQRDAQAPEPPASPMTVTIFGDSDSVDSALIDEFGRRGARTHNVTTVTGWLQTSAHAVLRIDTEVGVSALRELSLGRQPLAHVVVTCDQSIDENRVGELDELSRLCGTHHDILVIWHPEFSNAQATERFADESVDPTTRELASRVADEFTTRAVAEHPAFSSHQFVARAS